MRRLMEKKPRRLHCRLLSSAPNEPKHESCSSADRGEAGHSPVPFQFWHANHYRSKSSGERTGGKCRPTVDPAAALKKYEQWKSNQQRCHEGVRIENQRQNKNCRYVSTRQAGAQRSKWHCGREGCDEERESGGF